MGLINISDNTKATLAYISVLLLFVVFVVLLFWSLQETNEEITNVVTVQPFILPQQEQKKRTRIPMFLDEVDCETC